MTTPFHSLREGDEFFLKEAAEGFIRANRDDLNEFQVDSLRLLFDDESGPEDYAAIISYINREIHFLEEQGFRPYAARGDMVVRPRHYDLFAIEPTFFNMEYSVDWCRGNALKYLCRYRHKNGVEDLRKAARYIEMFIKFLDGDPNWSK